MFIENNPHIGDEIYGTLFPCFINARQNSYGYFQSGGGFRLFHKLFGNSDRMKYHALIGTSNMGKQAMFNRIVF